MVRRLRSARVGGREIACRGLEREGGREGGVRDALERVLRAPDPGIHADGWQLPPRSAGTEHDIPQCPPNPSELPRPCAHRSVVRTGLVQHHPGETSELTAEHMEKRLSTRRTRKK